jgi:hypothetical protein
MTSAVPPKGPTTPSPVAPPAPSTLTSGKITAYIGLVVAVIGFLNTAPVLTLIPPKYAAILTAIGAVVAKFGGLLHTDQSIARSS